MCCQFSGWMRPAAYNPRFTEADQSPIAASTASARLLLAHVNNLAISSNVVYRWSFRKSPSVFDEVVALHGATAASIVPALR
jgi:hypothetical protein